MTISLKHAKTIAITEDPNAAAVGEVVPSDWNDEHALTQATGKLLGRTTAGTGATEEITPGSTLSLASGALDVVTSDFSTNNDTNVTLAVNGSGNLALGSVLQPVAVTAGWTGTLAAGRLNSNVVQGVTNDTNVTGSIAAQNLTLGWTGTLAAARLNSNVVQSVTNDTNVTGSIATQNLTLGWTGTLALSRLAQGTDGQLIVGQTSAAPAYKTITGDVTFNASGVTAIGSNKVANSQLAQMAANTIKANNTGSTANAADITVAQMRTMLEQGMVLLNVLTASSSATLDDTTSFTSAYDDYVLIFENLVPATNAVGLRLRYHSGGSFQSSTYLNTSSTTDGIDVGAGATNISNNTTAGLSLRLTICGVNGTTNKKFAFGLGSYFSSSSTVGVPAPSGFWNGGNGAVDGFSVLFTSGNISTGKIYVYGLRTAL